MTEDRTDRAKVFIWGEIGELLKEKDRDRLLAVIQSRPEYYLGQKASRDIDEIIIDLLASGDITPELEARIIEINELDSIFRETAKLLRESDDMLSIGSMALGELDKSEAIMRLFGED